MQHFEQLEYEWAMFNNLDPNGMVACSSGTAALHLALEAMQLPQGSKCIVPDLTMIACPRAVTLAGLEPVFVDCGDDLNMDTVVAESYMEDTTAPDVAVLLMVHIYGRRSNVDEISAWRYLNRAWSELKIIEDLAETHGIRPHNKTDAACWSFYQNKIIAGQEGGAVWFKDNEHAKLARQLRSLGFTDEHDFNHVPRGHNYRMSNIHAQLILESMSRYWDNLTDRWRQVELLDKACPKEWRMPPRQAPWVYDLRIPGMNNVQQNAVVKTLNDVDIGARHCFKPCSLQREYRKCQQVAAEGYSKAVIASDQVIYLPLTPNRPRIDSIVFDIIESTLQGHQT